VSPGAIRTELGGGLNAEFETCWLRQTALGRVGEPDEVGRVDCHLLTDESRWINAQTIEVAGGYTHLKGPHARPRLLTVSDVDSIHRLLRRRAAPLGITDRVDYDGGRPAGHPDLKGFGAAAACSSGCARTACARGARGTHVGFVADSRADGRRRPMPPPWRPAGRRSIRPARSFTTIRATTPARSGTRRLQPRIRLQKLAARDADPMTKRSPVRARPMH
jgi:hypothetical protein